MAWRSSSAVSNASNPLMKAIYATESGNPSKVVQIKDVPIPEITQSDQVLIKVSYAAINPVDWKTISGRLGPVNLRKPAHIPGISVYGFLCIMWCEEENDVPT